MSEVVKEKLEEYAENIGVDIEHAVETLSSENPSQYSDEAMLIRFMDKLFGAYSETFSAICDELAAEQIDENQRMASEAIYDAIKEDCLDTARNVGSIPWPSCQVNPGKEP